MQFARHTLFFCLLLRNLVASVLNNGNSINSFVKNYDYRHADTTIQKVSFTQKGYIQFLKYISHVPPLTEYTFCIWMRSNNLTYAHPLLSYSKHEEDRLIRVWISPHGTHINLEILERHLFTIPVHFVEHRWYHICQSWSSYRGVWNLFLNGKLESSGLEPQLQGVKIKGGGDIVVGQEYTDFDKGLDDGIEGDVFGFNFVLASTSHSYHVGLSHSGLPQSAPPFHHHYQPANEVPRVLSYFTIVPNRAPKAINDIFDMFNIFDTKPTVLVKTEVPRVRLKPKIIHEVDEISTKPIGLKLVELSYVCFLGRGSPISGKEVLISWTKSPVRVFGGAILKKVPPFCT